MTIRDELAGAVTTVPAVAVAVDQTAVAVAVAVAVASLGGAIRTLLAYLRCARLPALIRRSFSASSGGGGGDSHVAGHTTWHPFVRSFVRSLIFDICVG